MGQKQTKILKLVALGIATVLVFSLGYYVGASPASPDVYLDDLPSPYSYVIKTDGSEVWAVRYDGRIPSNMASTDAYVVFAAVRDAIAEYGAVAVRQGDYTFSQTFTSAKHLGIIGEGSGTLLLPNGVFDALDPANLDLRDLVWRDANGIDTDETFDPIRYWYSYRGYMFFTNFEGAAHGNAFTPGLTDLAGYDYGTNDVNAYFAAGDGLTLGVSTDGVGKYLQVWKSVVSATPLSWDENRRLRVVVSTADPTKTKAFFGMGATDFNLTESEHVGFQLLEDGSILGSVGNGTVNTTVQLLPMNSRDTNYHTYSAVYTAGRSVRFYYDNVYRGQITSNLPTADTEASYVVGCTWQMTAVYHDTMTLQEWLFIQEP